MNFNIEIYQVLIGIGLDSHILIKTCGGLLQFQGSMNWCKYSWALL